MTCDFTLCLSSNCTRLRMELCTTSVLMVTHLPQQAEGFQEVPQGLPSQGFLQFLCHVRAFVSPQCSYCECTPFLQQTPLAPLIFKFPQLLASDFLFSSTPFSTSCFLSSCSPACSSVLLSNSSHLCSSPLTAYPASKPTPDNFPPPDFSSYNRSFSLCHQEPTLQPASPYTPPAPLAL